MFRKDYILILININVKKSSIILSTLLVATVLFSVTNIAHAESLSLYKQVNMGMDSNDIVCANDNHILATRDNGNLACATEKTIERLGWKPVIVIEETRSTLELKIEAPVVTEPVEYLELQVSSPVEFVDDGREFPQIFARAPAPEPFYDYILDQRDDYPVDDMGLYRVPYDSHEKYSIKEGVGFYPEDWMPSILPDGYKLLYITNDHYEKSNSFKLRMHFVPNDFILNKNTTSYSTHDNWDGFTVYVGKFPYALDETKDSMEGYNEFIEEDSNAIIRILDKERDGKFVNASETQNNNHYFTARYNYLVDDFTVVTVHSNYLTLEELEPTFYSVGK